MNVTTRPRYHVVTVVYAPFVMYNSSSRIFYGYCIDLLNAMARISGFDYDIRESNDKDFDYVNDTIKWTGEVGELVNGTADFSVGPLWVTYPRRQVVDFTIPFYNDNGIAIMMQKPNDSVAFLFFLTILEHRVWLDFAILFLVTSILICVFERYSPPGREREAYEPEPRFDFSSPKECFWFCFASLTPYNCGPLPRNPSGKFAAAVWWLFAFVIAAVYNANLGAYLTLYQLDRRIETIEDLRRQYQVEYSTVMDSPTFRYFESLKDKEQFLADLWKRMNRDENISEYERAKLAVWEYPFEDKYTKIYNAMKKTGFLANMKEAVDYVRKVNRTQEFAFVGEALRIRYLVLTNCDLKQVGEEFGKMPVAFAVRKGSPLKSILDDAITRVMIRGLSSELEKRWWDENPARARCATDRTERGFTFNDMVAIFLLIFIGTLSACFLLCLQYCWYIARKRITAMKNRQTLTQKTVLAARPPRKTNAV